MGALAIGMCGRYTLTVELAELASRFGFAAGELAVQPRFNVAPTQGVLTVVGGRGGQGAAGERRAGLMRWGLIPAWAKDAGAGNPLINARAESLADKPSFRDALEWRRCLIPADGFYEWQVGGGPRRPWRVKLKSGEAFAFAGLWERWQGPGGEVVHSCAIVTTEANELLAAIHPRMPVLLARDREGAWLDGELRDTEALGTLLTAYPAAEMELYRVSERVNTAGFDGPECIAPVVDGVEEYNGRLL